MDFGVINETDGNQVVAAKSFVGGFSRDMTLANGNQSVVGVGFRPTYIIFNAGIINLTGYPLSFGFTDGTNDRCRRNKFLELADQWTATSQVASMVLSGAADNGCTLASLDADGFTVTWAKSGSPTGTCSVDFLAIK